MTPRLKELLERRKAKADTDVVTISEAQADSPKEESPALILVPFFDCPTKDRFSEYF